MGHKNKPSIVGQVDSILSGMLAIGESKHQDKQAGQTAGKIYSWCTYRVYMAQCCRFMKWAKEVHGCQTVTAAQTFAGEYLEELKARGLSASSLHTTAAALGKLYQCPSTDLSGPQPPRLRSEITRSRLPAERDKGFSPARNPLVVALGECVGVRRSELEALTGDKLVYLEGGKFAVVLDKGTKGGRPRVAPVVGPSEQVALVVSAMQQARGNKVLPAVNSHADIHHFRAVYARRVYDLHARSLEECRRDGSIYHCRRDRKGVWYDKKALQIVSEALGHSRLDVVTGHYLY